MLVTFVNNKDNMMQDAAVAKTIAGLQGPAVLINYGLAMSFYLSTSKNLQSKQRNTRTCNADLYLAMQMCLNLTM